MGQPVLHAPAQEVTVFDDALADLVERMFASMKAAVGAGLAAPQIGVGLRVFVYDTGPGERGVVVNPSLERLEGGLQEGEEGCLSVPDLAYETPRAEHVRVTGVGVRGEPVAVEAEGFLARCFQHEVDHLDGRLYLERLGGRTRRRALKDARAAPWYGDAVRELSPPAQAEGTAAGA
ncbi:peptide deformylase [Vallicoccus soli]|uniref:Peptide deformylase n=2 Tax=Vallicoccus soli TaxID=2339232 RepID=A0A3A3Z661_9ACTN|nr:peptide deformylase [Vallicoccus soli]